MFGEAVVVGVKNAVAKAGLGESRSEIGFGAECFGIDQGDDGFDRG